MIKIKECKPSNYHYCKQCFENNCYGKCNLNELVRGNQN